MMKQANNEAEYLRGHKIEVIEGKFVYIDTKESTIENYKLRPCGICGLFNTNDGHDGCLGTLPNVMNACCGHGQERGAYIQYWNGSTVQGKRALKEMKGMLDTK